MNIEKQTTALKNQKTEREREKERNNFVSTG